MPESRRFRWSGSRCQRLQVLDALTNTEDRSLAERRLADWLRLLGYEISESRRYLHELPWGEPATGERRLRRGLFYPLPGGAYLLKARKRLHALTPPRPRLRERRRVLGGLTEPSSVNRSHSKP